VDAEQLAVDPEADSVVRSGFQGRGVHVVGLVIGSFWTHLSGFLGWRIVILG
jgi:hypothetical protein